MTRCNYGFIHHDGKDCIYCERDELKAELTALKSLVREMGEVISELSLDRAEIIHRSWVRAIMQEEG